MSPRPDLDVSHIVDRAIRREITNRGPELEALGEVWRERRRQNEKWGEQNHPDGVRRNGDEDHWAAYFKAKTDQAAAEGTVTWRDILNEEVAEAFAEEDPAKLRAELIQVAAVCVQWAEAIDRRGGPEAASERALAQLRENLGDDSRLAHDIRDGRLPLRQPGDPMGSAPAMGQP